MKHGLRIILLWSNLNWNRCTTFSIGSSVNYFTFYRLLLWFFSSSFFFLSSEFVILNGHTFIYLNKYQPLLLNGIPFPVFFFGRSYAEALEKMHFLWVRHYFYFKWPSEKRQGLAVCSAKAVSSFLSYSKTLRTGLAPGIKPAISLFVVKHTLPTELILPRLIKPTHINVRKQWAIHQGWNE